MPHINAIRDRVSQDLNGDVRELCLRIVNEVGERLARNRVANWSFQNFGRWVGLPASDCVLQQSILLLSSAEERRLLDMHFLFFDPQEPSHIGEPVDDEEVSAAIKSGYLIHPDTGERIAEFESFLAPYFVPSKELRIE